MWLAIVTTVLAMENVLDRLSVPVIDYISEMSVNTKVCLYPHCNTQIQVFIIV